MLSCCVFSFENGMTFAHSPFVSFKLRHIFEFVSCKMLICWINVDSNFVLSSGFFELVLFFRLACADSSSSEFAARHGSLKLEPTWKQKNQLRTVPLERHELFTVCFPNRPIDRFGSCFCSTLDLNSHLAVD